MSDEHLRELERRAAEGDAAALSSLLVALVRAGTPIEDSLARAGLLSRPLAIPATSAALLELVCAAPFDDALRLAYAAWLESLTPGDPLGEYIRLRIRCTRESLDDQPD